MFLKIIFFAIFLSLLFIPVDAQTNYKKDSSPNLPSKQLLLKVNKKKSAAISLRSVNTPVSEITAQISKHYNFPFALSRSVANYKPVVNLVAATPEDVFRQLAPFVIIEKEISGGAKTPLITGVYMYGYNENIPTMEGGTEISNIQSFIFEGNTETLTDEEIQPKSPIIKYTNEKLSVSSSSKESLILIVSKIAEKLGTPLTVLSKSDSPFAVNFSNLKPEEAFRYFPPNVVLKYQVFPDKKQTVFNQIIVR